MPAITRNIIGMIRRLINDDVLLISNDGAPTNGTSGTGNNLAGPGSFLIDFTNTNIYRNTNTKVSPTWTFITSASVGDHLVLNTLSDNRQVRINNRSYTQTSGDSLGFQSKPSQTVNSSGSVQGGQISPRLQSGITLTGSIIGLHVDFDLKGTAAGTIGGDVRVLELEMIADVGGGRTIDGDATAIRVRSFMPASGGVTGTKSVMKIETVEPGGVLYDGILDLKSTVADLYNDTDSAGGGSLDGFIKVIVNDNARYIRLYDAAPG